MILVLKYKLIEFFAFFSPTHSSASLLRSKLWTNWKRWSAQRPFSVHFLGVYWPAQLLPPCTHSILGFSDVTLISAGTFQLVLQACSLLQLTSEYSVPEGPILHCVWWWSCNLVAVPVAFLHGGDSQICFFHLKLSFVPKPLSLKYIKVKVSQTNILISSSQFLCKWYYHPVFPSSLPFFHCCLPCHHCHWGWRPT